MPTAQGYWTGTSAIHVLHFSVQLFIKITQIYTAIYSSKVAQFCLNALVDVSKMLDTDVENRLQFITRTKTHPQASAKYR